MQRCTELMLFYTLSNTLPWVSLQERKQGSGKNNTKLWRIQMIPTAEFPNQHKWRDHQQAFPQHPERKAQYHSDEDWK